MSVTVIVPTWNRRDLLARLLASLDAQTETPSEVLVVDNGSTDGAPELARARGARVIPMGRNAGFAAAVNRGVRESRGAWIAVLNNDVELAPAYLATLRAAGAAFATGKILSAGRNSCIDGTFDVLCRGGASRRALFPFPPRNRVSALDRHPSARRDFRPHRPPPGEFRILFGRRGFRRTLRGAEDHGPLRAGGCRLASRERHAGPLASGYGAPPGA